MLPPHADCCPHKVRQLQDKVFVSMHLYLPDPLGLHGQPVYTDIPVSQAAIPDLSCRNLFLQLCRGLPGNGANTRPNAAVAAVLAAHPDLRARLAAIPRHPSVAAVLAAHPDLRARLAAIPRHPSDTNMVDHVGKQLETAFSNMLALLFAGRLKSVSLAGAKVLVGTEEHRRRFGFWGLGGGHLPAWSKRVCTYVRRMVCGLDVSWLLEEGGVVPTVAMQAEVALQRGLLGLEEGELVDHDWVEDPANRGRLLCHAVHTTREMEAAMTAWQLDMGLYGMMRDGMTLRPVYSEAKRSQVRGLMFYDRDVSAALNIRRCAVVPGPRPTELCYWEGRPAMPKPGRLGQEWMYTEVSLPSACTQCGKTPDEGAQFYWRSARGSYFRSCVECCCKKDAARRAKAKAEGDAEFLARKAAYQAARRAKDPNLQKMEKAQEATDPAKRFRVLKTNAAYRGISVAEGPVETESMRQKLLQPCHYCAFVPPDGTLERKGKENYSAVVCGTRTSFVFRWTKRCPFKPGKAVPATAWRCLTASPDGTLIHGLDRVDSQQGYSDANTVPACPTCNLMKGPRPSEEFLQKVRRIAMFLELGEPMAGPRNPLPIATDKTARKARKENILTDDQKVGHAHRVPQTVYVRMTGPIETEYDCEYIRKHPSQTDPGQTIPSLNPSPRWPTTFKRHYVHAQDYEAALLSQTLDQTRSHVHDWEAHGHQLRNSLQGQAWSLTDAASHCSSLASSLAAVSDAVQAQQRMLDKMGMQGRQPLTAGYTQGSEPGQPAASLVMQAERNSHVGVQRSAWHQPGAGQPWPSHPPGSAGGMQAHRGGDSPMPPEVARQLQDMQASLSEVATAVKALGAAQGAKEQPPQARKSGGHRPTTARVPVTGRYSRGELMSFRMAGTAEFIEGYPKAYLTGLLKIGQAGYWKP
ncbi:hypothetical protein QJQ45_003208 [Haematococcus lacustris]|nr:hypothetical protein QJQ45_003208 [Haematococcus lacustris]